MVAYTRRSGRLFAHRRTSYFSSGEVQVIEPLTCTWHSVQKFVHARFAAFSAMSASPELRPTRQTICTGRQPGFVHRAILFTCRNWPFYLVLHS